MSGTISPAHIKRRHSISSSREKRDAALLLFNALGLYVPSGGKAGTSPRSSPSSTEYKIKIEILDIRDTIDAELCLECAESVPDLKKFKAKIKRIKKEYTNAKNQSQRYCLYLFIYHSGGKKRYLDIANNEIPKEEKVVLVDHAEFVKQFGREVFKFKFDSSSKWPYPNVIWCDENTNKKFFVGTPSLLRDRHKLDSLGIKVIAKCDETVKEYQNTESLPTAGTGKSMLDENVGKIEKWFKIGNVLLFESKVINQKGLLSVITFLIQTLSSNQKPEELVNWIVKRIEKYTTPIFFRLSPKKIENMQKVARSNTSPDQLRKYTPVKNRMSASGGKRTSPKHNRASPGSSPRPKRLSSEFNKARKQKTPSQTSGPKENNKPSPLMIPTQPSPVSSEKKSLRKVHPQSSRKNVDFPDKMEGASDMFQDIETKIQHIIKTLRHLESKTSGLITIFVVILFGILLHNKAFGEDGEVAIPLT